MKSLFSSPVLAASLASNIILAALVLAILMDSPSETAVPPVHETGSRQVAETHLDAAPAAAMISSPETLSSSLPVPESPPVSQAALAPISAPPTAFTSRPVTSRPLSAPPQKAQNFASAGTSPTAPDQASPSAAAEDPSLGPSNPVNPSAPGNFFVSHGVRVAVAETYPSAKGGGGMPLGIDLSPADNASSEDPTLSTPPTASPVNGEGNKNSRQENSSAANPGPSSAGGNPSSPPGKAGPSVDDADIFRMKWGWDAYAAAQTAAKLEADNRGR